MACTAVAVLSFYAPQDGLPLWRVVPGLAVLGLGLALFSAPNTNAVMGSVHRSQYGLASATLSTMRITGQMFSMAVTMMLFSVYIGKEKLGPGSHLGLDLAFGSGIWLFAALAALGTAASLKRRAERRPQNSA